MPRARSPNRDKAFEIYKEHNGKIENRQIAKLLDEDEKVIAVWKSRDNWGKVVQQTSESCTTKKKKGAPMGNKNAVDGGAPKENKNAEKHGLFSKYLPEDTLEIINTVELMSPIDILWQNISIQYAAIIRAQKIMHVRDSEDITTTKIEESNGDISHGEKREVQQAWDKQANFLQAQARAMTSLNGMIKSYDELLHKNWDAATEEQKLRIQKLKVDIAGEVMKINGAGENNELADAAKAFDKRLKK